MLITSHLLSSYIEKGARKHFRRLIDAVEKIYQCQSHSKLETQCHEKAKYVLQWRYTKAQIHIKVCTSGPTPPDGNHLKFGTDRPFHDTISWETHSKKLPLDTAFARANSVVAGWAALAAPGSRPASAQPVARDVVAGDAAFVAY